ncbi:uncharacterized protein DIPPA_06241 [Diplonema papillatum]|nr:uncharacterized protein DIPPA_06241 [Diplonema papillatum]
MAGEVGAPGEAAMEQVQPEPLRGAEREEACRQGARAAEKMREIAASWGSQDASEVVEALMTVTQVHPREGMFRFFDNAGITALCDIVAHQASQTGDDTDVKLVLSIVMQTVLGVSQLRSYMLLKGVLTKMSAICCTLLRMTAIEGGSSDELLNVHLEAAGCLNLLPIPHDEWVQDDIPQLCILLLQDPAFQTEFREKPATDGPISRWDAGLLLVANFSASEAFFDEMLELGLVECLVSTVATRLDPAYCAREESFVVMVRLLSVLLVVVGIEHSRKKLEFYDSAVGDDSKSILRGLLPVLADHDDVAVRSLAHQVLAEYAGVTQTRHEWIDESIPPSGINDPDPSFSLVRPCSNPSCENTEEEPFTYRWCAQCNVTAYCGNACHNAHWKDGHKKLCKSLAL